MKALVLAAGYATRLYPLTENKPKCLLTVGGRTILDSICKKINEIGQIDEIVIVTNAKFYGVLEAWRRGDPQIRILNDGTTSNETRLGAIGDLALAMRQAKLDGDLLMLASDNLFDASLSPFVEFAVTKNAVATGLWDIGDPAKAALKYGVLTQDASGRIVSIEEKPQSPRSSLIGMGVYYFPEHTLGRVSEYLASPEAKDAPGHYLRWLLARTELFGFVFPGLWYDIGDLQALEEANEIFKGK